MLTWEYIDSDRTMLFVNANLETSKTEVGYYDLASRKINKIYEFPDKRYSAFYDRDTGLLYTTSWYKNDLRVLNLKSLAVSRCQIPKNGIFVDKINESHLLITAKNERRYLYSADLSEKQDEISGCWIVRKIGNTNFLYAHKQNSFKITKFLSVESGGKFNLVQDFATYINIQDSASDVFFYEKQDYLIKVSVPSFKEEVLFKMSDRIESGYKYQIRPINEAYILASVVKSNTEVTHVSRVEIISIKDFSVAHTFVEDDKFSQKDLWWLTCLNHRPIYETMAITEKFMINIITGEKIPLNFWKDIRQYTGCPE